MLSQSVGYAAAALGVITAAKGDTLLIREIAALAEVPAPYLAKLIHTLARKGVVRTQRGIGGGVVFLGDPSVFTLYDLCMCLDDPVTQKRCMLGLSQCSDERACPCHKFWLDYRAKEIEFLQRTTIADIGDFGGSERARIGKRPKN